MCMERSISRKLADHLKNVIMKKKKCILLQQELETLCTPERYLAVIVVFTFPISNLLTGTHLILWKLDRPPHYLHSDHSHWCLLKRASVILSLRPISLSLLTM